MNFDERDSHWENFLQGKANLSASFAKDSCCKVCLCLELLKLSTCKDSCYRPQEENELIDRLLQGILDPDTFCQITSKIKEHLSNVNYLASLQEKIQELENSLRKVSMKSSNNSSNASPDRLESSKLESLVKRIENYEDTLIGLRKENEELRAYLKKILSSNEELALMQKKSFVEARNDVEALRDEQGRIRAGIDSLMKSVNENALALKEIARYEPEFKVFKAQVLEEAKDFNEKTTALVRKIQENAEQTEKKIDENWSQIQDLKKEHENVVSSQKECKLLARHSNHLLSAADSVYSTMNQISDFNHYLETRLDSLNKDLEIRMADKVVDEWTHPGNYTFDDELQKFCWSCCKASQDGKGCEKR